jgi:hypothetical protein
MRYVLVLTLLVLLSGCGNPFKFDPATTVILKITGVERDEQEDIEEEVKELVQERANWHMTQVSQYGETLTIKATPVEDVQGFADRIDFGEVTSVEDRIIHVAVAEDD